VRRILHIATREFLATVATKGFIVSMLLTPLLIALVVLVLPHFLNERPPSLAGEIAVIDPTGRITERLGTFLDPEAIAERHDARIRTAMSQLPPAVEGLAGMASADSTGRKALEVALGETPRITVVSLPPGADIEKEKEPLKARPSKDPSERGRLALVVVHPDAVRRALASDAFGSYDLWLQAKIDDRIEDEIRDGLREAIVEARVADAGLDRAEIETLTRVPRVPATTVTDKGERKINPELAILIPMAMTILLVMAVMTSGQALMMSTIEEKSTRVAEVLLSAVSPIELMTGKILGQMGVGLVVLALYGGAAIIGLASFALLGLVDPTLLVYLVIFFLISYFVMGSLLGAIGAAVNELGEAQNLMTPIMLVMTLPWILWMPISRNPNSALAVSMSLIPPVNSFGMILRMSSTTPPPLWQVWLSIGIGLVSVWAALWISAKVFRVGILMFGKPPNLATLVRWVRMAG
jgi:ABC-2 type transport system permease protein